MKIGLYIRLLGRPGTPSPAPTWDSIRAQALAALAQASEDIKIPAGTVIAEPARGLWNAPVQAATHWDSLGHIFLDDKMYNGHPARLVVLGEVDPLHPTGLSAEEWKRYEADRAISKAGVQADAQHPQPRRHGVGRPLTVAETPTS